MRTLRPQEPDSGPAKSPGGGLLPVLGSAVLAVIALPAAGASLSVLPGELASAIAAAVPGDELVLAAGRHPGPVVLDKRLTLTGRPGAVIDGGGRGQVVRILGPDITLRGLTIRGSGQSLPDRDAGVFVGRDGSRARIEHNLLVDTLIGVDLWGAADAVVAGNRIAGRTTGRVSERGNGVQLWNSPGSRVVGNDISGGRDGIFTNVSRDNRFEANRIRGVRYAVHYMYTQDSAVVGNLSYDNEIGYAIMYSDRVTVTANLSDGDRAHGLLLNYANSSTIENNIVRHGGEKCVFIYNANKNVLSRNRFEGCGIGIHFTAGSERNRMFGNAFVNNRRQVMYVGARFLDWSADGRGNYWSDNPAFDLNGDGIADTAYRPNDLVDQVVWTWPAAKLLLNSPGVQVIRWAQAAFPALHPGGVIDSRPLMTPPAIPEPQFQPPETPPWPSPPSR
ncbi:MAG: nitrous oxide reductase family maturation protein NosD [Azospirillum sp.]|nr:nitrous oxide reductase family maturation protein NosD [Azospirillum sp.]